MTELRHFLADATLHNPVVMVPLALLALSIALVLAFALWQKVTEPAVRWILRRGQRPPG